MVFFGFWFKQVKKADNHGNPENCGNVYLLVYICWELKKYVCVWGGIYLCIYHLILFLIGILILSKDENFWETESYKKYKYNFALTQL